MFRRAADEMQDAPTSIMLKYLQVFLLIIHSLIFFFEVLNNISTKNNLTVVVPVPKALLQPHVWKGKDCSLMLQTAVNTAIPIIKEMAV